MGDWYDVADNYQDVNDIKGIWRLAEEYSVTDAAALIAGYEPTRVRECIHDTHFNKAFPDYDATLNVLRTAVIAQKIKAKIRYSAREYGYTDQLADIEAGEADFLNVIGSTAEDGEILSDDKSCFYKPYPDWHETTVDRDSLIYWMERRGYTCDFFFPKARESTGVAGYLSPENPRYAPKLAASIRAWESVTDPGGKTPKQALEKWLNQHAAEFGLTDGDGLPIKQAIEECAKVANWKPSGGAPTTPGE